MLTEGVWAEVKVGNEYLRLFSEHNAQGASKEQQSTPRRT
jgi:hypothetical protein